MRQVKRKLTEEDVRELDYLCGLGVPYAKVAAMYNISKQAARFISLRLLYPHIPKVSPEEIEKARLMLKDLAVQNT